MGNFLVKQTKGYALGNFIMLTPTIKRLSEKLNQKIDVFFEDEFVKNCFIDCNFINIVDYEYKTPDLLSSEINKTIPDYKNIFIKKLNEPWNVKYHTYVDMANEVKNEEEKYILFLNGLAGLSLNEKDEKPHWYGKKEIDLETFKFIKQNTKLPIYFTGSKSDIYNHPWINDYCDKIFINDIRKSLALIRDATKIISNDTGLAHCASALNKEILILWKDTPFVKNTNPGLNTHYSKKGDWKKNIISFFNGDLLKTNQNNRSFIYIIPSYNRFDKLINLIENILNINQYNQIITINDGSNDKNYNLLKKYDSRVTFLENKENFGKSRYWITVDKLFKELSKKEFTHCVMLNDDLVFEIDFNKKLNNLISDDIILRLFTPKTLIGSSNWGYKNWIDGIFCAPKKFFEKIGFKINQINNRGIENKSSGVGEQLTNRLNKHNFKVDFFESLLEHNGNLDSKMHPKFRLKNPLYSEKTKTKTVLSIVIPTYKNINYLDECIISILNTNLSYETEILIGVDGCKESLEFLEESTYPNYVKMYYFEDNMGPYTIKNTLAEIAKSENLLFFDSDDIMNENMIQEIINGLKNYVCVKPKFNEFGGKSLGGTRFGEGVFGIRKSLFMSMNGFEPWMMAADSDFMGRLYKKGLKILHTPQVLFKRRVHPDSLTNRKDTGLRSIERARYAKISKNKRGDGNPKILHKRSYVVIDSQTTKNLSKIRQQEIENRKRIIDLVLKPQPRKVVRKNTKKGPIVTNDNRLDFLTKTKNNKEKKIYNNQPENRQDLINKKKSQITKTIRDHFPKKQNNREGKNMINIGGKRLI